MTVQEIMAGPMPWQNRITGYYNGSLKSSDSLYIGTAGVELGTRLGSDATVLVKNSSELNRLLPGTEIRSLQLLANVEFAEDNVPQEATGVKYARLPRLVDANGMDIHRGRR